MSIGKNSYFCYIQVFFNGIQQETVFIKPNKINLVKANIYWCKRNIKNILNAKKEKTK